MRSLTRSDLFTLWERGEGRHPVDRALLLMAAAFPERRWDELVSLSIGRRNSLLTSIREQVFGRRMDVFTACPRCDQPLEFALSVPELRAEDVQDQPGPTFFLAEGDLEVSYRLPNSADLAALVPLADPDAARGLLLRRCLLDARREDAEVSIDDLPESVIDAVESAMETMDPQAEVALALRCPQCAHAWSAFLDILSFMWTEISAFARRLLGEVHSLARYYGWREADILSMSSTRRKIYLEMMS